MKLRREEMIETKTHDPLVYRVYDELKTNHVGQANAIQAPDLAFKFGISERKLRSVINEIRNSTVLEKLVASDENGYYVCANESEFNKANWRLLSAGIEMIKTARANEKKAGIIAILSLTLAGCSNNKDEEITQAVSAAVDFLNTVKDSGNYSSVSEYSDGSVYKYYTEDGKIKVEYNEVFYGVNMSFTNSSTIALPSAVLKSKFAIVLSPRF